MSTRMSAFSPEDDPLWSILLRSISQMANYQVKSAWIMPDQSAECPLFSPKQTFVNTDLDSVSMSAFGHKQSFRFYAYTCILTVNERLLSAISGHSQR